MPVDGPLPGTGDQHDINADATRCLMARHPKDWRLQSLETYPAVPQLNALRNVAPHLIASMTKVRNLQAAFAEVE